eukprot:TRINITY_DN1577_c0_g1_i1.p1 TRINITY_DN1577_c0_g1~~TRINITY_DN1577_c0_g1_i1.p1  ORF type:complete len:374 (+),score=80.30 TRINITY_DN1577_c0_g1_i1:103-1224(+)
MTSLLSFHLKGGFPGFFFFHKALFSSSTIIMPPSSRKRRKESQPKSTPAPKVSKATPAPKVSKATPAPKVSKATPASKVSKATPASKVSKATPASKMSKITPDSKVSQASKKSEGLKITSWNVDGLRAWIKKGCLSSLLETEIPDIICLQETKCSESKLPAEIKELEDYPHKYWAFAEKEGYSGVALFSKVKPLNVQIGLGSEEHDREGRALIAEFDSFYLLTTYVPNAGRKLMTLEKRLDWDPLLREKLAGLDKLKPVIACGDFNVAHNEIDLANPKNNKRNAGFTQEERSGFDELLSAGFVDTFRRLNPEVTGAYTFWTYMMKSRDRNVGWRLDYFLVSQRWFEEGKVLDSLIENSVKGSDHCPITLTLRF